MNSREKEIFTLIVSLRHWGTTLQIQAMMFGWETTEGTPTVTSINLLYIILLNVVILLDT